MSLEEEAGAWEARKGIANTCAKQAPQAEGTGEVHGGGGGGKEERATKWVAVGEMVGQRPSAQGRCMGGGYELDLFPQT